LFASLAVGDKVSVLALYLECEWLLEWRQSQPRCKFSPTI